MSDLFSLIKINLKSLYGKFFVFKGNKKSLKTAILVGALFCLIALSIGVNYYDYAEQFKVAGLSADNLFIMAGLISVLIVVYLTITSSQATLFKSRDYELMASMPIKRNKIVISKIVTLLISSYLYTFVIFAPACVVYFMFESITFYGILACFVGFVFIPLIPTIVGLLLGFVVTVLANKSKHKNVVTIVLSFIFIGFVIYFYTSVDKIISFVASMSGEHLDAFSIVLPSVGLFYDGVLHFAFFRFALFIILPIVLFSIAIWIVSKFYDRINQSANSNAFVRVSNKTIEKKSTFKLLMGIEAKKVFTNPTLILNTSIQLLFVIALPFVLKFAVDIPLNGLNLSLVMLIIFATTMFVSMAYLSACSVSLDAQMFYALKSMPIKATDYVFSKVVFNVLFVLPFIVFNFVVTLILFIDTITVYEAFMLVLLPLFGSVAYSLFGVWNNLKHPLLNFVSAVQVIKQSGATFIQVIAIFAFYGVAFTLLLSLKMSIALMLGLLLAVLVIVSIFIYVHLKKNAEKLISKIE